jgi:HK97 family phage major capsid protein
MPAASEVWVATRNVTVDDDKNGEVELERGQRVAGDCPGIQQHPDAFERFEVFESRERLRTLARNERALEHTDDALRTIDGHSDRLRAEAADRLDELVRYHDPRGTEARYLRAVGDESYNRAFGKILQHGSQANLHMTREEQLALQRVNEVVAERALSLTGSAGGFAVPFELDPTIILTSAGVVNPIRELARVIPVSVDEWRGVSSAGVTASYAAEATETTDNSPTLAQPTISTEKAQAFIPFSIEVGMDWAGMREELARLLADAKDTLEAQKFVNGTGTNEPFGLLVGVTNTVNAAGGADAFTAANVYALAQALPARYRPRASFIADLAIINRIAQFETTNGARLFPSIDEGRLLQKTLLEASELPDNATTGNKFLIVGDFSGYVIVDRIGLQVELIPHLFGASRRPTGERGMYSFWRNGAKVVDAGAFRALIGTA